LVFAIVAVALFMVSVDLTIVSTALSAVHRSLHASINWTGWTISIYGLFTVVSLAISGKLCNQLGRRRVFVVGVALFTATSLLCGLSSDIYMLVALRGLQALGGGAIQPAAAGLIADHFTTDRSRAIGMFGVVSSAGQIAGPIFGGLLVGYLSWRWIFFVNVPIGAVVVFCCLRYVPASVPTESTRTDLKGLVLMASGVLGAILAVTDLGDKHTTISGPTVLVPGLGAIVLLALFVRHERRVKDPFIPLQLLRGKGFVAMNWINLLHGTVTFGIAALVPLYAANRYHLPAVQAGTLLTARAVGMIAFGVLAASMLRRTGYRLPMFLGFSTVALGTLLMSVAPRWGLSPFTWLALGAGIAGSGLGAVNPAASNAAVHLAPTEVAAITGLRIMFINLGVIFSVSITTAILNRSSFPGLEQAHIFWVAGAVVFAVMLPLITRVPESRSDW
jgi:EmrB/QacA subfamily drug resistance transporter